MGATVCRKRFPGLNKWDTKLFIAAWSRVTALRKKGRGLHDTDAAICITLHEFTAALNRFGRVRTATGGRWWVVGGVGGEGGMW